MSQRPAAGIADRADAVYSVRVRDLTKRYPLPSTWRDWLRRPSEGHFVTALAGVDLAVKRGEVLGLMGPNGAGKTTLLKILCTILLPTEGEAVVEGYDVVRAPATVRDAVGYCLDADRSFYHRLTGVQNLTFFAALSNVSQRAAEERIRELLQLVGLNGHGQEALMTYSKGMQQRLGLARALLTDPAVILLDEPTRSLDPPAATEFRRFLRETLAGSLGKTVLLATHSPEEARDCCDRVVLLDRGRVRVEGPWTDVEAFIAERGFSIEASAS